MNKKNGLEDFSLEELSLIREEISKYEDINELKESLDNMITNKDLSNDINERFNFDMFKKLNIFSPYELEVLELNKIYNIKDLIEANLSNCVGMTQELKEKFEWARTMYGYKPKSKKNR